MKTLNTIKSYFAHGFMETFIYGMEAFSLSPLLYGISDMVISIGHAYGHNEGQLEDLVIRTGAFLLPQVATYAGIRIYRGYNYAKKIIEEKRH